jgi:hypothetical protein
MKKVAPAVERWYASRDRARAEAANTRLGGQGAFSSYEDALADPNVTAVLIALPPAFHLEWTLKALDAHKHVNPGKTAVAPIDRFRSGGPGGRAGQAPGAGRRETTSTSRWPSGCAR